MGDMTKEPSMEEILSSIKRIIAEEGEDAIQAAPQRRQKTPIDLSAASHAVMSAEVEEVLELTDEIPVEEVMPAPKSTRAVKAVAPPESDGDSILSVESEVAARHSLSALSTMLVSPREGEDNTLEALVRSMLRPMLKEWLDARLPALVEDMVAKEISRITGR